MHTNSDSNSFGKDTFGPFLLGFSIWLKNEADALGIKQIIFLSRDGYLMQKAFNLVSNSNEIKTQYAYFSRNSIRRCRICQAANYDDTIDIFNTSTKYITTAELMVFYGVNEEEYNEAAQRCGVSLGWYDNLSTAGLKQNVQIKTIVNHLWSKIIDNSAEQEKLINAYASQSGMTGKFAIVDIGWQGTMQRNLENLMPECTAQMTGFYVGMNNTAGAQRPAMGWCFNDDASPLRKKLLCFLGVIEKLFQSHEGSTDHYKQTADGSIIPVLAEYEYPADSAIVDCIKSMQQGALDYVKEHKDDFGFNAQKAIDEFIRFGSNPTKAEMELFCDFYNIDGSKINYLSQKPIWQYGVKEFLQELGKSPWKTGFLKSAIKLPLPYFAIYSVLKK